MTVENVTTRFMALTGLTQGQVFNERNVIRDAYQTIYNRALPEVRENEESCRLLEAAAAALAFYNYLTVEATKREYKSFKAGEFGAELCDGGMQQAYQLYVTALKACDGLLETDGFQFGRVESLCSQS